MRNAPFDFIPTNNTFQLKERSNFFSFLKQIQHNKFIIFQIHFTQFFAFKFHAKQTKFLVNSKNKFRLKTIYVKCCFAKFLNSQFGFTFGWQHRQTHGGTGTSPRRNLSTSAISLLVAWRIGRSAPGDAGPSMTADALTFNKFFVLQSRKNIFVCTSKEIHILF